MKGDNAVDGLALAYADESRLVDSNGNVKQLILQVKVMKLFIVAGQTQAPTLHLHPLCGYCCMLYG